MAIPRRSEPEFCSRSRNAHRRGDPCGRPGQAQRSAPTRDIQGGAPGWLVRMAKAMSNARPQRSEDLVPTLFYDVATTQLLTPEAKVPSTWLLSGLSST